jgi:hypothetical protein
MLPWQHMIWLGRGHSVNMEVMLVGYELLFLFEWRKNLFLSSRNVFRHTVRHTHSRAACKQIFTPCQFSAWSLSDKYLSSLHLFVRSCSVIVSGTLFTNNCAETRRKKEGQARIGMTVASQAKNQGEQLTASGCSAWRKTSPATSDRFSSPGRRVLLSLLPPLSSLYFSFSSLFYPLSHPIYQLHLPLLILQFAL